MDKLFNSLRPFVRGIARHPWLVLILALVAATASVYAGRGISIDSDLAKLIPDSYPSVQALEKLKETVGSESDMAVAIQSPSFEANKAFAEDLIPRALAMRAAGSDEPYLTRVDYRRDTEFMEQNALYFATDDELDSLESFLDARIEDARLEANPFFFDLDLEEEDEAVASEEDAAHALQAVYDELVGTEYPISPDSTTMVLHFHPSGAQTNIAFIESLYADMEELTASMDPSSFHPEMEITLAGRLLRQATEVRAITKDVFGSFGTGASIVLLMVVVYFSYKMYYARVGSHLSPRLLLTTLARTPVLAILIGLPLLISLTWTLGAAYASYGTLNLMTSTLFLVLFGLGIDFGIHFFARYSEERGHGRTVVDALEHTLDVGHHVSAVHHHRRAGDLGLPSLRPDARLVLGDLLVATLQLGDLALHDNVPVENAAHGVHGATAAGAYEQRPVRAQRAGVGVAGRDADRRTARAREAIGYKLSATGRQGPVTSYQLPSAGGPIRRPASPRCRSRWGRQSRRGWARCSRGASSRSWRRRGSTPSAARSALRRMLVSGVFSS